MNFRVLTQVTHGLAFILSLRKPGEKMKCQMTGGGKYISRIQKEGGKIFTKLHIHFQKDSETVHNTIYQPYRTMHFHKNKSCQNYLI